MSGPWALAVLAAYALTRVAYYATGARFDDSSLPRMWHFVAVDLLHSRLLESIFYLHFQPPLYNLYLGSVLQLFGTSATAAFAVSYLLLGACYALALFWFMRALGLGRGLAFALLLFLIASPPALLLESYLLYSYPVVVWLVCAAAVLYAAVRTGRRRFYTLFFALLALIVLTRALFHPLWMLLIVLALTATRVRDARRIWTAAAVPLLLVGAVCVKNGVVFGVPGTSSWTGIALARMTVRSLPSDVRKQLVREGKLSPLADVRVPSALQHYRGRMAMPAPTRVPVLDRRVKPNGAINLHHLAYVEISRRLGEDALYVIRNQPQVYARSIKRAARLFVSPTTEWHGFAVNAPRIAQFSHIYNRIVHFRGPMGRAGLFPLLLPLSCAYALYMAVRGLRRGDPRAAVFAFMALSIAYVTVAGCLLEPRENMRFRQLTEPFMWIAAAHLVRNAVRSASTAVAALLERRRLAEPAGGG